MHWNRELVNDVFSFLETASSRGNVARDKARWDVLVALAIRGQLRDLPEYWVFFLMEAASATLLRLEVEVCSIIVASFFDLGFLVRINAPVSVAGRLL